MQLWPNVRQYYLCSFVILETNLICKALSNCNILIFFNYPCCLSVYILLLNIILSPAFKCKKNNIIVVVIVIIKVMYCKTKCHGPATITATENDKRKNALLAVFEVQTFRL